MNYLNLWNILGIIAIILLVIFARGKNSVWGGLTIGIVIGIVIALIYLFKGESFSWVIIKKSVIVGVLVGGVADLFGRISQKLKK